MTAGGEPVRCYRYQQSVGWEPFDIHVVTEASVALDVNGENWLTFTCTPSNLDALAAGFLFNEKIIQTRDEIAVLDVCRQETHVDVWLNHPVKRPERWQRTSGCTGGVTAIVEEAALDMVPAGAQISPQAVLDGMAQLFQIQELYRETRGIHSSALSDGEKILLQMEDIGRHNTLDKLAGRMLITGLATQPVMLLTTGRVSSEMLQKSARMGVQVVVSRTSPTSASIQIAERTGITLVGYARHSHMIVYTHPNRLNSAA